MKFNKGAKPMRKVAAFLAIALLLSLAGCGGSSGVDDVPSPSNIESQTPSETPEVPPEETPSTQAPSQSEKPEETTQAPIESEGLPEETIAPTIEPTSPPASSAPVSTSAPSSAPTSTPTPTHTHSYTSTITKQATCDIDGVRTYNCSCGDSYTEVIKATGNHNYSSTVTKEPTCAEEGIKSFTCSTCGNKYTEAISRTNSHNWTTRHIDEVGHMESNGTHMVMVYYCNCGEVFFCDNPDAVARWHEHSDPFTGCEYSYRQKQIEVPNDPQYIIDSPAHDETYCSICGITQ